MAGAGPERDPGDRRGGVAAARAVVAEQRRMAVWTITQMARGHLYARRSGARDPVRLGGFFVVMPVAKIALVAHRTAAGGPGGGDLAAAVPGAGPPPADQRSVRRPAGNCDWRGVGDSTEMVGAAETSAVSLGKV